MLIAQEVQLKQLLSDPVKKPFFKIRHPLNALLTQLPAFGLNPRDWEIVPQECTEADAIDLRHRTDCEFRLKAAVRRTNGGELKLGQLQLLSL